VVGRMTLQQKISFVVLSVRDGVENINAGIPDLCIPPLTLSDGPNGIAYGVRGSTQLPASIGLAASFNPAVTYAVGQVQGAEAEAKGIDVVQGPELNLARVPVSGRIFEGYGEDPELTAAMGLADVEGIQSQGVMAMAKHVTAYNEEADRSRLNQDVTLRELDELYDAPFVPVVQQGHVASLMCSYGELNGTNTCSNPFIYAMLRSWGFTGFVRSDRGSIVRPATAFSAGLNLIKPNSATLVTRILRAHSGLLADLDAAVVQTLSAMFAYGLVAHPRTPNVDTAADSPAHAQVSLWAAEQSMVLLKNRRGTLPLSGATSRVVVIGDDAGAQAQTSGSGSSWVRPESVATPISALRAALGPKTSVTYVPADDPRQELPPIPTADLVRGEPLPQEMATKDSPLHLGPQESVEPGKKDLDIDLAPNVTAAAATASRPGNGPGWSSWRAVLKVPHSGTYQFSLQQVGDTWLYLNGRAIIASRGLHGEARWSVTTPLLAGKRYDLAVDWFTVRGQHIPELGLADQSPEIARAVQAARRAHVAIVFASNTDSEGVDQPNLNLPGDADPLISAVAAANHHTVVVLNTGGAVLMPWLSRVAAVVEAWYPGQADGTAVAAVLDGRFDPSGHLPITFPTPQNPSPVGSPRQYPGVDGTVHYTEGLDIGYRWYEARHVTPQFPFGYGLSYTSFVVSHGAVRLSAHQVVATVRVRNSGTRAGTAVVQAYLQYPAAADEPPLQLRAFDAVDLQPSQDRTVRLVLPASAFEAFLRGRFQTVAGLYRIDIGQSSAALPIHLVTHAPPGRFSQDNLGI
jgi:beta-glucosidase